MYISESECIFCGACFIECPEGAVVAVSNGKMYDNKDYSRAELNIRFEIDMNKCNECSDRNIPLCFSICPMDSIKINKKG